MDENEVVENESIDGLCNTAFLDAYNIERANQEQQKWKNRIEFFKKMIPTCLAFALLFVFCCYDNYSGITVVLFQTALPFMAVYMLRKIDHEVRLSSYGFIAVMALVGISGFFTMNPVVVVLNYCAEFLLLVTLLLHNCAYDYGWDFSKYFGEIIKSSFWSFVDAISFGPAADGIYAFRSRSGENKNGKNVWPVILGIIIGIPFVVILCGILGSADSVFDELVSNDLWEIIDFDLPIGKIFLFVFALTASYCGLRYMKEKALLVTGREVKKHGNVTVITVSVMVTVVYLLFSMIQILFLFAGNFKLPEGMNYAEYARQGFFQLLFVSAFNLFAVLMVKKHVEQNKLLEVLLYVITGCTYIMTFSSGFRMMMYIDVYGLTTLRVLVMLSLALIAVLLVGVILKIRNEKFNFFKFGTFVVSAFYIGYAFSHSEYFIAKYNLTNGLNDDTYIYQLSSDAIPAIEKYAPNKIYLSDDKTKDEWWEEFQSIPYHTVVYYDNELMNDDDIKTFNLSKAIGNSYDFYGYNSRQRKFIFYGKED